MKPPGAQQLFCLLVVVVERRQSSESQCGREGGEEREGPSQAAPDRFQKSGKHLRGEQGGTAGLNYARAERDTGGHHGGAREDRKTTGARGRQQKSREMGRDPSHLSDRLL